MPWDYTSPRAIRPGDEERIELPYSEVCMYMRVAGKVMGVRMLEARHEPAAQLLNQDGSEFPSFPILLGEAGIFRDAEGGYFCYPEADAPRPANSSPDRHADPITDEPDDPLDH